MKLAIFGATGKTGRHLVQQGLEKGHELAVLVRDPAKLGLQNPKLRVVKGDVLSDTAAIEQTVSGADAVTVMPGEPGLTLQALSFADLAGFLLEAAGDPKRVKTAPIVLPA